MQRIFGIIIAGSREKRVGGNTMHKVLPCAEFAGYAGRLSWRGIVPASSPATPRLMSMNPLKKIDQ